MDEIRDVNEPSQQPSPSFAARPDPDEQFIGTYSHTVDAKGRLVVPQSFREMLGASFYVAPSLDFTSVSLYTKQAWSKVTEQISSLAAMNTKLLLLRDQFYALSYRGQECDGQGRLLLPPRIRQLLLGEEKELEISGAGDHVDITGVQTYAKKFRQVMDDMPDIMETINMLRIREMTGGPQSGREA